MRERTCSQLPPAAQRVCRTGDGGDRVVVCRGDVCPRCGSGDTRGWGSFSGRRRFRCRACLRTFSTFTGTPLHYLKAIDRWRRFLRSIDDRNTIRRSAAHLRVHPSTAFRWRHRLLSHRHGADRTVLGGRVHLDLLSLAHNEKGRHPMNRPPRRHAYGQPSHIPAEELVSVALLWESDTRTLACSSEPGALLGLWVSTALPPRLEHARELVTGLALGSGQPGWPPDLQITPPEWRNGRPAAQPRLHFRLRRWLRPFRGVATRYLDNYLQWFRDEVAATGGVDPGGRGALRKRGGFRGGSQQFPRTQPEWWRGADRGAAPVPDRSRPPPPKHLFYGTVRDT